MRHLIETIRQDEVLSVALEYGLLASAIAVAILAAVSVWGGRMPKSA